MIAIMLRIIFSIIIAPIYIPIIGMSLSAFGVYGIIGAFVLSGSIINYVIDRKRFSHDTFTDGLEMFGTFFVGFYLLYKWCITGDSIYLSGDIF